MVIRRFKKMTALRIKWKPLRTLAIMLCTTAVSAQVASPPPPQSDPFVGTWQANRDKSRPKLGKKDASYVRTIAREGEDLVFSSQMKGSSPWSYRLRCDGLFHPVPFGSLACQYKAPNLVEGTTLYKRETLYWTREVSADGKEMKLSSYKDSGRTKVKEINVLDRVN